MVLRTWAPRWCSGDATSDTAGDGTTTATVLAQAIVRGAEVGRCGMNRRPWVRGHRPRPRDLVRTTWERASEEGADQCAEITQKYGLSQRRLCDRRHDRQGDGRGSARTA